MLEMMDVESHGCRTGFMQIDAQTYLKNPPCARPWMQSRYVSLDLGSARDGTDEASCCIVIGPVWM